MGVKGYTHTDEAKRRISEALDVLRPLKEADSWEAIPQGFKVAVLSVCPHAWGTVPASGLRHSAHLEQP